MTVARFQRNTLNMEEYGKIYVVVGVLALILLGIFGYLFSIDRKLTKLEKEAADKFSNEKK